MNEKTEEAIIRNYNQLYNAKNELHKLIRRVIISAISKKRKAKKKFAKKIFDEPIKHITDYE